MTYTTASNPDYQIPDAMKSWYLLALSAQESHNLGALALSLGECLGYICDELRLNHIAPRDADHHPVVRLLVDRIQVLSGCCERSCVGQGAAYRQAYDICFERSR